MGVFISRGMTIRIPAGGLRIGPHGNTLLFHVHFDVCPTWIKLALRHLEDARSTKSLRQVAWAGTDEDQKAAALEKEFEASMQCIMAAAISIDAFYAVIQTHVKLPHSMVNRWRANRTPRYSQITEVLRKAFGLKPKGVAALRRNLKEIYRFRDLAVHPSGKIQAPVLHPELNVGVEWRFAYYRGSNAEAVVNAATWIIWELAYNGKPAIPAVQKYIAGLQPRLSSLFPTGRPVAQMQVNEGHGAKSGSSVHG